MFRVIVAGSRDFDDYKLLKSKLDFYLKNKKDIVIMSGTARGADKLGEQYAKEKGYQLLKFPADWNTYGKRAGYIRNKEMLKNADAVICFWDGISKGTEHMIEITRKINKPLRVVKY